MILDHGVKTTEANAKDKRPFLSLIGARLALAVPDPAPKWQNSQNVSKVVHVTCAVYSSQRLKWINTFHQSCPKTKTITVRVLGQVWLTFWLYYILSVLKTIYYNFGDHKDHAS